MTHTRYVIPFAGAMLLVMASLPSVVVAQDAACATKAAEKYAAASPDLSSAIETLSPDERRAVVAWLDCGSTDLGLARVHEEAVRTLDQRTGDKAQGLFVSASQLLTVTDPTPVFPRSEILPRIRKVPAASRILEATMRPPAGAQGWRALLADLNAEVHGLEAWTSLNAGNLVAPGKRTARDELAAALLATAAYLAEAQAAHPETYDALAKDAGAVDALGRLWTRAEDALAAAPSSLGTEDAPILNAIYADVAPVAELFKRAGRKAPALTLPETKSAEPPVVADTADAGTAADTSPKIAEADAGTAPAKADAGTAAAVKVEKDAGAAPIVKTATPPAEKPAPDPAKKPVDAADKDAQASSLATNVRLGILGFGAVFPWLLVGLLALMKKRRKAAFPGAANRTIALLTFLIIVEALALGLIVMTGASSKLASLDALYLLIPPYAFAVVLTMVARLDVEGQLRSRKIIRNWAKWGSVGFVVVSVVNVVLAFFSPPAAVFAVPVSIALVGLAASVFTVRLWRSGADAIPAEGEAGDEETPEDPPEGGAEAAPKPKPEPKPKPQPKAPKPQPRAAEPEAPKPPSKPSPPEASTGAAAGMSDADLAAAFDALGGDEDDGGDVPDDRSELYKLLGGD